MSRRVCGDESGRFGVLLVGRISYRERQTMIEPKAIWTRVPILAIGGGLGFWVANDPILESLLLSLIALIIVTALIEFPAKFLTSASDA
jgi:hypothetical protein